MIDFFRYFKGVTVLFCTSLFLFNPNYAFASNDKTVAVVMKSLANPFFSNMEKGAREYAQAQNIPFEVFGVDRETDVNHQIGIVKSLIARKYGAIVIAPADSKRLVGICKEAMDNGITVINIDNPLHKPTMAKLGVSIPFVGSDNYVGAQKVGNYVKKKLNNRGRVLVVEGIRGVENADLRKKGFIEAVTTKSSIEIVSSKSANWHTDEAFSVTTELLGRHKNIDAIFCANDAMALGALQAIDMVGPPQEILIAGYDNIDSVRTEINNGRIHATIEQHPELMGKYGVEWAWKGLNGDKIPDIVTPLDLITYESFNKKIALSISTMKNSFFQMMVNKAKLTADLFGIELIVLDANNEDAQQLTDIVNVLSKKINLLILNPTNTEALSPGVEIVNDKGIPVITVDRKVATGKILCHIESDNAEGGRMAAEVIAKQLNGAGKVFEIEGIPGTSAAHERGAGFNTEIKKYDQIEIVNREVANFDRKEAKRKTLRILNEGGHFDGVFAHNDNMIFGVIDAFQEADKTMPKVLVGFDALPEARRLIKKGALTATIAQKPDEMGKMAIEIAARHFRGESIPSFMPVNLSLETK